MKKEKQDRFTQRSSEHPKHSQRRKRNIRKRPQADE
jgi:hypothetical protein